MCTLIVLHRCVPDRPLVVAANRDEFLDRPAEELAVRSIRTGPIVSPLDLEAGGTWVGLNAHGVFAGLTNLSLASMKTHSALRVDKDKKDDKGKQGKQGKQGKTVEAKLRSRGEVVMMALEAESAADAVRALSKLAKGIYNPFQLLVADGKEAWLVVYRGSSRIVELEPGPHILGNVVDERIEAALGAALNEPKSGFKGYAAVAASTASTAKKEPRARKLTRIGARVEKMLTEPGRDYFEGLAGICREHIEDGTRDGTRIETGVDGREEPNPFESTCVHVANRYGTRSSLLLELSMDPAASRLWTTDGPPCERSFENRSFLLRELGVRLSNRVGTEPT